jgi:hypothetical protein
VHVRMPVTEGGAGCWGREGGRPLTVDDERTLGRRASESRAENMPSNDVLELVNMEPVGASAVRSRGFQRDESGRSRDVSRARVVALLLWVSVVCVLLGVAAGYRPLKDSKVHDFEDSPWHQVCISFTCFLLGSHLL